MLIYTNGNILSSDEPFIAHGCNCFNTMGRGFAAQIAKDFPAAKAVDAKTVSGDRGKLGTFTKAICGKTTVYNMYTQYRYGTAEPQFDYRAFEEALAKVLQDLPQDGRLSIPKIGAGLAGGDWPAIAEIINKVSDSENKDVLVWIV